jgi:manganese oxidase
MFCRYGKKELNMVANKSTFENLTIYLAVISLVLLMAAVAVAQSPGVAVDKPAAVASQLQLESKAASGKTLAITSEEQTTTGAAADTKGPETENSKTKVDRTALSKVTPPPQCQRTITADVVAIAQPIMLNRLGAAIPGGMIFALRRDTVGGLGKQLRADKRPRPIVLRANVGDCLTIKFENAIPPNNFNSPPVSPTSTTSEVSLHVEGMEWVTGTSDDGSFVGKNNSSLASASPVPVNMPPATQTYNLFAREEGTFLLYTMGDTSSTGNQLTNGLFGALNVQPAGAEWYRSQVSQKDLKLVTKGTTADGHPIIDYAAVYPAGSKYPDGTSIPANTPILNMLDQNLNIVHTDLTAMITGPKAGRFPGTTGVNNPEPNCNAGAPIPPAGIDPLFCKNPAAPDRKQPYREFTIIYHGALGGVASQAFPILANAPAGATQAQKDLAAMTQAGQDGFAINYGTGGIGAEIYANRIGVGPMGNCVDCKFEEFFLSAWSVGDPAMLVDRPANSGLLPAFASLPTEPPLPANPPPPAAAPPQQCTATQLGDNNPPTLPDPNCANTRVAGSLPLDGTVTFSGGSKTVTGVGTKFKTELGPGSILVLQANPAATLGTVQTITDDLHLTLTANAGANASGAYGVPTYTLAPLPKATRAYYPDDPSNVYHSYINDHLKFRILHGGRDVTHVHHQHAHQWLQSPNSDESSYLDSQMISPGASYTLEMVYNGSGNRNKVVGDSIFHCHFYPHFAAGMWAMWRTHDVFEGGSELVNGIPDQVKGTRALPDGEIVAGTPIPAIVPLPTISMAPLPSDVFINKNGQVVYGTPGTPDPTGNNVTVNPGFPFFIPGVAGARAPHPPLDFAPDGLGGFMDGGLPRHVVTGGSVSYESHDLKDWSKDLATMNAIKLPEDGTNVEKVAMKFFGHRCFATFFPNGSPGSCPSSNSTPPQSTLNTPPTGFILNGLPLGPQSGAPFADPAIDDNGNPVGTKRIYKAAAIQADVAFNKKRWHFPQQRMLTLWKDAQPTIDFTNGKPGRPPEPMFFRANSGDVIEYWHTNLVPNYYLVDDFQVRTPTDILGQHIHLVKFDVTSSDGAGNGFNYEDGTFAPAEVQEVIRAINHSATNGFVNFPGVPLMDPSSAAYKAAHSPPKDIFDCVANPSALRCQPCPDNATPTNRPVCLSWLGAQTTIQRWYVDPLVDDNGKDRTLRTVFTHDHFGPSTHQQAGLYAGLLIEPQGSTWTSNDGATTFGSRSDGGPTSWEARILTSDPALSYREFALEFQDLQLAYSWATLAGTTGPKLQPSADPKIGWTDPAYAINPPGGPTQAKPDLVSTGTASVPVGTQTVNYRNDPVAWRIGPANDMSYIYDSALKQAGNAQPNGDPFTPLMRTYQNDNVQVRTLVGAHVFAHQFNLAGPTWFSEPAWKNSGYRSAQAMGLSEHFEMLFHVPSSSAPNNNRKCPDGMSQANCVDYLYSPSLDEFGIANGMWGLVRSYDPTKVADKLATLPNNPVGPAVNVTYSTCPAVLPPPAKQRVFNVTAVTTQKALANQNAFLGNLVFNRRGEPLNGTATFASGSTAVTGVGTSFSSQVAVGDLLMLQSISGTVQGKVKTITDNTHLTLEANATSNGSGSYQRLLSNPLGVMYVRSEDLDANGVLKPGVPVEPLILRANAGDCIEVNLTNALDPSSQVFKEQFFMAPPLNGVNPISKQPVFQSKMSGFVGLHPQLLSYDSARSNGMSIGWNRQGQPNQLAAFGQTVKYQWYAGKIERNAGGTLDYTPVEFGSLNLFPSDQLYQNFNGLFGQMIIEPAGSTWQCGETGSLRDCDPSGNPPPTSRASATVTLPDTTTFRDFALMISDDIRIVGQDPAGAVNYRTEPWNFRYAGNGTTDFSCMLSNQLIQPQSDPQTPIFTAEVGDRARFRFAHPFGTGTSQVAVLNGHVWQRNPYRNDSKEMGNNSLSQWIGSRDNHGSTDHFDILVDKAGGERGQAGDYLYSVFVPIQARNGAWGLFRVGHNNAPMQTNAVCAPVAPVQPIVGPPAPKNEDVERFIRQPVNKNPKP